MLSENNLSLTSYSNFHSSTLHEMVYVPGQVRGRLLNWNFGIGSGLELPARAENLSSDFFKGGGGNGDFCSSYIFFFFFM